MRRTRRSVLKAGGMAAVTIAAAGITTANQDENGDENKLNLRGGRDSPLDPTEIQEQKEQILDEADYDGPVANIPIGIESSKKLVAYNFYVNDDKIVQWKGTIDREDPEVSRDRVNNDEIDPVDIPEPEKSVLSKADEHAKVMESGDITPTSTQFNDPIQDWGVDYEDDDFHESNDGNKANRTIYWAMKPDNDNRHAINSQMWVRPNRSPNSRKWNHEKTVAEIDWGSWTDYGDHGPGNTIGSNADYTEIGTTTDEFLSVAIGEQVTSSNLNINDKSDPSIDYVKHQYDISGDLTENYAELNIAGTAATPAKYVVTTDVEVNFDRAWSTQDDKITFGHALAKEDGVER